MTCFRTAFVAAMALAFAACVPNELGNLESKELGDMVLGEAPHGAFDAELVAACGDGGRTTAGDAAIARAPYVQSADTRSAAILWTTTSPEPQIVLVWRPGDEPFEVAAPVDVSASPDVGEQLIARIGDLEPSTIYCYEVRDAGGEVLVAATGFRTAPAPGNDAPVRFVALGDLGKATTDQLAVADQLMDVEHDFAVLTGDVAYDSGSQSSLEDYYFAVYEPYIDKIPVFPAAGNHDHGTDGAGPFRQAFALPGNERWYSFDWGDVHVAVLDTESVGAEQAAWLERDLAATDQPWKIVVGHKPPYSAGYHGSNTDVRDTFAPIFERHGVQLTLWGHDHDYERTRPINGVTYVVTGGGGTGTRPVGSDRVTAFSQQVSHLVYVSIEGDELELWAIDATGQTFDTVQISR